MNTIKMCLLFLFLQGVALSSIAKSIEYIEIFYVNPENHYFAGLKKEAVINYSLKNSENNDFYYFKLKNTKEIDSFSKLFSKLVVCRKWEEEYFDARIVVKVVSSKKVHYIILSNADNQLIFSQGKLYNSNANFYRYLLSFWPLKFEFENELRDRSCSEER